jgi:hypothetical protein
MGYMAKNPIGQKSAKNFPKICQKSAKNFFIICFIYYICCQIFFNVKLLFMKQIEDSVYELLDEAVDDIFVQMHEKYKTLRGDVTPTQAWGLGIAIREVSRLMADQIKQNID